MLSVALLSQAKKSEFGIAQPSSCIAGENVLNERFARLTARNLISWFIKNVVHTPPATSRLQIKSISCWSSY